MTIFERFPKTTLCVIWLLAGIAALYILEKTAQHFGLGQVVVYQSNPIYGYRPIPNQSVTRFHQTQLQFNNLSLRADEDWDTNRKGKVLFVGDSVTYGGSYISNDALFSSKAVENLNLKAGNAGVNGWGYSMCML